MLGSAKCAGRDWRILENELGHSLDYPGGYKIPLKPPFLMEGVSDLTIIFVERTVIDKRKKRSFFTAKNDPAASLR